MSFSSHAKEIAATFVVAGTLVGLITPEAEAQFGLGSKRKPAAPTPSTGTTMPTSRDVGFAWEHYDVKAAPGGGFLIFDKNGSTTDPVAMVTGSGQFMALTQDQKVAQEVKESYDRYVAHDMSHQGMPSAQTAGAPGLAPAVKTSSSTSVTTSTKPVWNGNEATVTLEDGREVMLGVKDDGKALKQYAKIVTKVNPLGNSGVALPAGTSIPALEPKTSVTTVEVDLSETKTGKVGTAVGGIFKGAITRGVYDTKLGAVAKIDVDGEKVDPTNKMVQSRAGKKVNGWKIEDAADAIDRGFNIIGPSAPEGWAFSKDAMLKAKNVSPPNN
jgi:hypothetical protein